MSDSELLPQPKPVRRLEVFTGSGAAAVGQRSGMRGSSAETVCAAECWHGLTPQQLFGWRPDARHQLEDGAGKGGLALCPGRWNPRHAHHPILPPRMR